MSLITSLAFKANGIFEVYFYVKMLSKFHTSFFQKRTYVTTSDLGYCVFSNLRVAVKLFAAVLQIKEAKIIVIVATNVPVIILLVKVKTLRTYSVKATF